MSAIPARRYVDFEALKARVSMIDVLRYYDLLSQIKQTAPDQRRGCCPIHKGTHSRQFTVTPSLNKWNCFSSQCGGGDIIAFVAAMQDTGNLEAAHLIARWFPETRTQTHTEAPDAPKTALPIPPPAQSDSPRKNAVLTLSLKRLDPEHGTITDLGYQPSAVEYFEAGYCTRGIMARRIAAPIHNAASELVGYAGYSPDDDDYKYPTDYGYITGIDLYNLHRVSSDDHIILILVPEILDVWRLHELGYDNAVAVMANEISPEQRLTLKQSGERFLQVLWPENTPDLMARVVMPLVTDFYVKSVVTGSNDPIRALDDDTLNSLCDV